ncbi:MAG: 3-hydroxyacyl-ACP dehydratase FabZ family protein [Planctomycetota bacterium]
MTADRLLFDLEEIDLSATAADTARIESIIPHRHEMALLDRVVFVAEDMKTAVGYHDAKPDAFWVRGHFPTRATLPGVLMVEAGAQLTCYLWNVQQPTPRVAAFLRIDNAIFRRAVVPGERLHLLAREVKQSRRRFVTEVQGVVNGELAFEAQITGMAMEEHQA